MSAGFEPRRAWVREAIRRIEADFQRSSDTHLIPLPLPGFAGIELGKQTAGGCSNPVKPKTGDIS